MDLDQQIQALVEGAPQDGSTPQMVESIAPLLKTLTHRLRHLQYYVMQTLDDDWVMITLSQRTQSEAEKNVIYAFPTLKDVAAGPFALSDPNVIAVPVPVMDILFQMLAMTTIYSIIFFETPGNVTVGTEVQRAELETLVHQFLQSQVDADTQVNIPSDIA